MVNSSGEDQAGKKKCAPLLEDYYECLHHKKEVSQVSLSICFRLLLLFSPSISLTQQRLRV